MRTRTVIGVLLAAQAALLAAAVAVWWTHRSNTLFSSGRWIVGKDTGKYVFYAHDFMFQPLTDAGVDLTSCMGFQEILYASPENDDRRLAAIECKAVVSAGAYLWIEWRKAGQRMTACRLSRNENFPGGFYRFDEDGDVVERVPMPELPARDPGEYDIRISLEDGSWHAYVDGRKAASFPDGGPRDGFLGFRGAGWNRRPVVLHRASMTFADPARPGRIWTERERFRPAPLRGPALALVVAFAVAVVILRALRQSFLAKSISEDRRGGYVLADHAAFVVALGLAFALQLARNGASGVALPLAVLAAECAAVVVYALQPRAVAPRAGAAGFIYALFLLVLAATAAGRHGTWLGRKFHATRALRENVEIAALLVRPDTQRPSDPLETGSVTVAPGRPFFTEGRAYGAQVVSADFVMPSNSTLDVVFQQQQFATRGDPDGEEIPLHRRLIRLSTRPDVSTGVSRRTDNRPLPFTPLEGTLRPGDSHHMEIVSDRSGLRITLDGTTTVLPDIVPIGYGETGFLAYEEPVVFRRIRVEPTREELARRTALPWLGAGFPLILAAAAWLLLRLGGRVPVAGVALTELAALFPAAFFLAASLLLPTGAFALLGRTRAAWFDLAAAGVAVSQFHLIVAFGDRLKLKPLFANLFLLAAVWALALFGWDLLPKDHPLRLKFTGDAVAPGDSSEAPDRPGPWYNSNFDVGSGTYIWKQRFGGLAIGAKPAGAFRVFVVGGSQAWGSGAASSRETFSELLERNLRQRGLPVEVFNAAVNGGGIRQSLALYRGLLSGFEPDLLVAVFGLNENTGLHRLGPGDDLQVHIDLQAGFLDELLGACRDDGTEFILVLEPMCSETPLQRIDAYYEALASTAREWGFPVLDPAPLFREKEAEHLVWWDSAHLAPYGQALMAEFLQPEVEAAARSE